MLHRIKSVVPQEDYILLVKFENGVDVLYDMKEDMDLPEYGNLRLVPGLFQQVQVDESRTCVFWNENIDLPSDTLFEFGKRVQ